MAYIGACPDMCPEKERQTRYTLKSMSIFERDKYNQPNVYAMVKEYRRSGADQEEPSPLDLRTPKALELTLDYLVTNVMDDSRSTTQELAGEWYDFLWDRLRAIRKDITQQNICDQASAVLVERCARFHVHTCYAMNRIKDFDLDMNKRNLNDCLQMVRQMYHDLKVSSGTVCAGELEFQKYDILLHLNEDHLSSTLLMKMSDYRSSSEMKFITQVFNAYTNNDYYKFFKLFERADYMTSCVLSLYANKIRIIGLKTIINACAPRQATLYPSELVTRSLGFDDDEDLKSFASLFGIGIQEKDAKLFLVLTKDLLQILRNYESIMPPFKSKRLVTDKMQGQSVGQLVYGREELPQYCIPDHYHTSMDLDEDMKADSMSNTKEGEEQEVEEEQVEEEEEGELEAEEDGDLEYYDKNKGNEDNYEFQYYDEEDGEDEETQESGESEEEEDQDNEASQYDEEDQDDEEEGLDDVHGNLVEAEDDIKEDAKIEMKNDRVIDILAESPKVDVDVNVNSHMKTSGPESEDVIVNNTTIHDSNSIEDIMFENDYVDEDLEASKNDIMVGNGNLDDVNQCENPHESSSTSATLRPLPNTKLSDIAREMPAGFFKVRSLSSRLPTLQLPPTDQGQTTAFKRVIAEPIQRKKLKKIAHEIEEEKSLNKVYFKITQMFTL